MFVTSKYGKFHKRHPLLNDHAVCGLGGPLRIHRMHFGEAWGDVTCGNCIASHDDNPDIHVSPVRQRALFQDSAPGGVLTVWEIEHGWAYPLTIRGDRIQVPGSVPRVVRVEEEYGPLTPVSELDMMWRYVRHLEQVLENR